MLHVVHFLKCKYYDAYRTKKIDVYIVIKLRFNHKSICWLFSQSKVAETFNFICRKLFFPEIMPQRRPMRCMGMVWEASGWMMWLVLAMKRQLLTVLTMNGETTTVRTRRMSGSYVFQTAVTVEFKHFIILISYVEMSSRDVIDVFVLILGTTVRPSTVAPQPIFFTAPQEEIVRWGQPFQLTCFTSFPDISKLNGHIVWCKNEIVFRNQTLGISLIYIYISIWLMIGDNLCALMS